MQDTRLAMYLLEHGFQWLRGGAQGSFWSAPFFYPVSGAIVRSDSYLGLMPLYYVVRSFAGDRETAYAFMFVGMYIINFSSCESVMKKLGAGEMGSGIAAFIFAFAMPVQAQAVHFQLLARFAVPPAFFCAWMFLTKGSLLSLLLTCAWIVIQWYCAIYTGFFLALAVAVFMIFGKLFLLIADKSSSKDISAPQAPSLWGSDGASIRNIIILVVKMVLAAVISIAALVPLLTPYYRLSKGSELISWEGLTYFLPRPASFLCPPSGSVAWGSLERFCAGLPSPGEQVLFPGLIPLLALIAAIAVALLMRKKIERNMLFAAAGAVAVLLLAALVTYSDGLSLYYYFSQIPGTKAVRAVSRIALVLLFPASACAGIYAEKLLRTLGSLNGAMKYLAPVVAMALTLVVFADQYGTFPKDNSISLYDVRIRTTGLTSRIKNVMENVEVKSFYYMPLDTDEPPMMTHIDAMLASQDLNIPTINGYSGGYPWGYEYFYDQPRSLDPLKRWMTMPFEAPPGQSLFDGLLIIKSVDKSDFAMINSDDN